MPSDGAPQYRHYRVPRADNTALVEPPLAELALRPPCPGMRIDFGGESLGDVRAAARRDLLAAATRYTSAYREAPRLPGDDGPVMLTGHQAELYHPGVWFKNFMLDRLAHRRGGIGIHLVIDTDDMHPPSAGVPTGSLAAPRIENVPLDAPGPSMAVEQRTVLDESLFRSFGKRATGAIAPLVAEPLIEHWWPTVVEASERNGGKLGLAIAQGRHALEAAWGLQTLELPMSECCQLPVFHQFAAWMLEHAGDVRQAYNGALADYRRAHGLRSSAQPMPNLPVEGDWIETPFWVYRDDAPARRAVFVRRGAGEIELTNRSDWQVRLSLADLAEGLRSVARQGIKLRTRALTTTLMARLLLGDLFLHGIGGAKYDEVTDDLARRLWGCPPPPYLTLSATLELPIEHPTVTEADLASVRRDQRDLEWHPENWLPQQPSPAATEAAAAKAHWVRTAKTPANAGERHRAITAANAVLRDEAATTSQELHARLERLTREYRATSVLESRDYAFCLFPEDNLRRRLMSLVQSY